MELDDIKAGKLIKLQIEDDKASSFTRWQISEGRPKRFIQWQTEDGKSQRFIQWKIGKERNELIGITSSNEFYWLSADGTVGKLEKNIVKHYNFPVEVISREKALGLLEEKNEIYIKGLSELSHLEVALLSRSQSDFARRVEIIKSPEITDDILDAFRYMKMLPTQYFVVTRGEIGFIDRFSVIADNDSYSEQTIASLLRDKGIKDICDNSVIGIPNENNELSISHIKGSNPYYLRINLDKK